MNVQRSWATPIAAGAFLLSAVTGVLIFFHVDSGLNKAAHEWLSWLLLGGVVLHVLANLGGFKRHFATRGGLAATLNEIAQQSGVGIVLDEAAIPVDPQVAAACEFLGLDPLNIANEGKLIAICAADEADALVAALRAHPLGARAARVGEVCADERCFVQMKTALGGRRMVDWLASEQLPRIC